MVLTTYEYARKLEPEETGDASTFSASDKNFIGRISQSEQAKHQRVRWSPWSALHGRIKGKTYNCRFTWNWSVLYYLQERKTGNFLYPRNRWDYRAGGSFTTLKRLR